MGLIVLPRGKLTNLGHCYELNAKQEAPIIDWYLKEPSKQTETIKSFTWAFVVQQLGLPEVGSDQVLSLPDIPKKQRLDRVMR